MSINPKSVYLFGASGHAKVVIESLRELGISTQGIFDDDLNKKTLWDIPILGNDGVHNVLANPCVITIGDNKIRKSVTKRIKATYFSVINKSSVISKSVKTGIGTVIMASATVNADTVVGDHVIINTSASIDHDCIVHDFVHIAPNATLCGGIEIGEGTLVGAGSTIVPQVKIGKWCTIGAGSVIVADVPDFATVVGNPGKIVKVSKL